MNAIATPEVPANSPSHITGLQTSPELKLLLLCARHKLSADCIAQVPGLLHPHLNWSVLAELADAHRLFPLFYWHATKTLALHLPEDGAQQMDHRFRANAARTLLLVEDLKRTIELLAGRGIQAVPFKGPALAESLYGDAALRECVDLDILVRPRDLPEAIRTLLSAGYVLPKELPAAHRDAFVATQYEYPVLTPTGTLVELQWRIVPRYFSLHLPEDQYWSRTQTVIVFGRGMNSLSWEDLLLVLCFHGSKHGWEKLIWLADVAELIASKESLDWEYILDQAGRAGGLRMVLLGVALANRLLGTSIPKEVEQALARDRAVAQIAGNICRSLVKQARPTYLESQLYLLRVRERWQDRLRYIARFTFTATPMEWKMANFPPSLSVLYAFLRVLRGIGKGFSLALSAAFRFARARL